MAVSGWAAANSAMRLSKAAILARSVFSSATKPAGDQRTSFHHRLVFGSRCGFINGRDALLVLFRGTAVVIAEELAQRPGMSSLQLLQVRPAVQQVPYQRAGHVIEPLQNLGKIQLQTIRQTMALPRLLIHHLPTFLHQEMQQAGFHGVRLQGAQPFAMTQQQIQ